MSTRATYQFKGDGYKVTIYIHHDGYPEGAASYYWKMLHAKNDRGGWATQFIRENDGAEITTSHEGHGDTEYQYTLENDGQLKAVKVNRDWEHDTKTLEVIFYGHVAEFINKFGAEMCEGFEPLVKVQVNQYIDKKIWITPTQLIGMLETEVNGLESYAAKFPHYTGNIDSMKGRVQWLRARVQDVLKEGAKQ